MCLRKLLPAAATAVVFFTGCQGRTIHGLVLGFDGAAVSGAQVRIDGRTQTTEADGTFAFAGAPVPYDAVVIVGSNQFTAYKGLTREDPVLFAKGASTVPRHFAQIAGTVTGGTAFPVDPATAGVSAVVEMPFGFGGADASSGTFSMSAGWGGPGTVPAMLRVLERSPGSPAPSAYLAYGERALTVSDGASIGNLQVSLRSIGTAHAGGHLSVTGNVTVVGLDFQVLLDSIGLDGWNDLSPSSTSTFSVPMPDLPGVAVRVHVIGSGTIAGITNVWRILRPGTTDVAVDVPEAPFLLSPPVAATDVPRTSALSWTGLPGGLYLLDIDGPDAASPHFRVVTSATTMPISEMDALSRLPPATDLIWRVTAIAPFGSVDAAADAAGYSAVARLPEHGIAMPREDRIDAPSSGQGFMLAP